MVLSGNEVYGSTPASHELEVTLFGPGYGECCLVHVGANAWIIVDSCLDSRTQRPAAIKYLEDLGIDLETAIRLLVVTHYHDDHIRGVAETLAVCRNARLCLPAAMSRRDFMVRVAAFSKAISGTGAVTQEIAELLKTAKERCIEKDGYAIMHAISDRKILTLSPNDSGHGLRCELYTLSPSDEDFERSVKWLAGSFANILESKIRLVAPEQNDLSIALLLIVGNGAILLGSDLEEHGDPNRGWSAVLANASRPAVSASVLKVPHHGGQSAHLQQMWSDLVCAEPWSVLTPWHKAGRALPSNSDIERIVGQTTRAYSTAQRRIGVTKIRRDRGVKRTIRDMGISLRQAEPATGMIRLRCSNPGDLRPDNWSLALFEGACELANA